MRLVAAALLAAVACAPSTGPPAEDAEDHRGNPDLAAARELDQAGVRAFREGRWSDALRYFRASYRMGGPPSEIWNVARCQERLDDPEAAGAAIDRYLALADLTAQDRAEAEREVRALRARASTLTITTRPAGALVAIDGRPATGPTPLSVEVPPGLHTIAVHRDGYATARRPLEARYGRAIIVSLELEPEGAGTR